MALKTIQEAFDAVAAELDAIVVGTAPPNIQLADVPSMTLANLQAVWAEKGLHRGDLMAIRAGESIYFTYAYSSATETSPPTVFIAYGVDLMFDGDPVINAKIVLPTGALDFRTAKNADLITHTSNTDIHVTDSDKTAWNSKQDELSPEQMDTVNSDPFTSANYSTTAEMTQAINEALESADVKGVIKFRGYFSAGEPTQPATGDLWVQGTRPAAPDFTGITVKQWDGAVWNNTAYTPEIFHLWSDLNEGGKGYYIFPIDEWNILDFNIDLEPYALKTWVFEQLADYQTALSAEQLAAVNSGITAGIISAMENFANRSGGFATSAQGRKADEAATELDLTAHTGNYNNPHRVTAEQLGIDDGARTLIVEDDDVSIDPNDYDAVIVKGYYTITFTVPILGAHILRCFKDPQTGFEIRAGENGAIKLESGDARNPLVIGANAKGFLTFSNGEIETSEIDYASAYAETDYPIQQVYADWLVFAGDGMRGYIAHYNVLYPMLPPGYDIHDFLPDIIALSNEFMLAHIPEGASWDDLFTEVAAFEPGRAYAAGERFIIKFAVGPQTGASLFPNDRNYLLPIDRAVDIVSLTAGQALNAYTLLKDGDAYYFTNTAAVWSDIETLQGAGLLDSIIPDYIGVGLAMVQKDDRLHIQDALVVLDAPYQGDTFSVIEILIDAWTILASKSRTPAAWYNEADKKIYCTIEPRVREWSTGFDFNVEIGIWVSQEISNNQNIVLEDPLDGSIFFSWGASGGGSGEVTPIEVTIPQGYVRNADMPVNPARWYKIAEVRGQVGGGAGYVVFDFSAAIRDSDPFGSTYDHMVKGVGYTVDNSQWNGGNTNMTRIPGTHIIGDPANWGDGSDPNTPHSWLFLVSKTDRLEFWAKEYKRLGSDANVYNVMVANIFANWQLGDAEPVYYINPTPVIAEAEGADAPTPAAVTDGMTGGTAMLEVW